MVCNKDRRSGFLFFTSGAIWVIDRASKCFDTDGVTHMKLKLFTSALVAAVFSASAIAQGVGTISAMTGETGSVVVVRGGQTYSLKAGDTVFEGDRIVTRSGGTVTIDAMGCSVPLGASQTAQVGSSFCTAAPQTVTEQVVTETAPTSTTTTASSTAGGSTAAGGAAGFAGVSSTVFVVGGVIIGSAVIVAAASDDEDEPASP